jgi:hypothetical protein
MGGTISIASIVNKGTTFTLTFKTNNMLDRILCIDDDPITLMLCKKGNCEDYVFQRNNYGSKWRKRLNILMIYKILT